MTTPVEDEFTELADAAIDRVDLVDKAANGLPFLMAKAQGGLLAPEFVRELLAKSEPETPPDTRDDVTVTGSPAAIAKLIHQAAVAKAKYDADELRGMAGNGEAMPDESYPIADRDDLDRAIRAVGRGGAEHDAIRRHVIARAKALGASGEIPDTWNADGSLNNGSMTKEMQKMAELDESTDGMDPTVVLAAPDGDAPGDPATPGSPAWEAIDAATAQKWTSILARAKNAIDVLAEREMLEAASADPDDIDNAFDLQDACCAIDYAISVLAPFAVAEQAEADCGTDLMAAVGKTVADCDGPLTTIEAFAQVTKAGRVLSTANEAAIRGAVEELQKVLSSLPAAPAAPETTEEGGLPVAKQEEPMPTITSPAAAVADAGEPVTGDLTKGVDAPVVKADKVPQVAVYDQSGNLVGIVDPGDIVMIAQAEPKDDAPEDPAAPVDEPAAAAPDITPAPPADAGTPADVTADDVAKETDPTTTTLPNDVLKSIAQDAATAALTAYSATHEEVVAKQAKDLEDMAETVETLKGQVKALEEQPAVPKVFTNGAVPPRDQLRGQDRGAGTAVDVAKGRELKKGLYAATDATAQKQIADDMQGLAIAKLAEIHQGGVRQ
ncbi:hypothetical protein [Streptomyces sp. NPDC051554]|uniref:hypothetical protein n=1 Tax=Streptomyces sp. NPDC051554 TaxID=3365656 RepID=UPI0037951790